MKGYITIIATALLTCFIFSTVLYSCTKDECKDVVCQNGGACEDGSCICPTGYAGPNCEYDGCNATPCANGGACVDDACACPTGYEGEFCETISREKFLTTWNVTEDGSLSNEAQYVVVVVPGPNVTEVRVRNFYNRFTDEVVAKVLLNAIIIDPQTVNGYVVTGQGTISDKGNGHYNVILRYKVTDQNGAVDDYGFDTSSDPAIWER